MCHHNSINIMTNSECNQDNFQNKHELILVVAWAVSLKSLGESRERLGRGNQFRLAPKMIAPLILHQL
jgi:hypothetical protein